MRNVLVEITEVISGSLIVPGLSFATQQPVGLQDFFDSTMAPFQPFKILLPLKMLAPHIKIVPELNAASPHDMVASTGDMDISAGGNRPVNSPSSHSSSYSPSHSKPKSKPSDGEASDSDNFIAPDMHNV